MKKLGFTTALVAVLVLAAQILALGIESDPPPVDLPTSGTVDERPFFGTRRDVAIDYDSLAANPDYLVVGTFGEGNGLYDRVIASGAFRLLQSYGHYAIYERVR